MELTETKKTQTIIIVRTTINQVAILFYSNQRRIKNRVKHLIWVVFQNYLTTFRRIFAKKKSLLIFDRVLNTSLDFSTYRSVSSILEFLFFLLGDQSFRSV